MKLSGIDWIGDIPAEWDLKKVKYVFQIVCGSTPESNNADFWDGDVSWITPADMNDFGIINKGERSITKRGYNSCGTLLLPKGSIVISTRAPIGKINITSSELCTNQGCKSLVNINVNTIYFYYFLNAGQEELVRQGRGTTFAELGTIELGNISLVIPPPQEQQAIAAYLDTQCGRIDSIITEMEQQIELLKQYKTSLITETVTKGLNKAARMKDSGIDWIGKIPAHWEVKKIRYLGEFQNGISKDGEFFGSGYPFVSYGDVYNNMQLPFQVDGRVESSKKERTLYSVKKGDVFFTRTSETIEEIGFASICEKTISDSTFSGFLIRFRPNTGKIDTQFSKFYFQADLLRAFFVKEMMIVTRASLPQSLLKNLWVVLPPITEQKTISSFLTSKCTQTDAIITEKRQSIETMKAYKKSLIYEYVTGKKRIKADA
jgi:type I restriction enzyme S subunit